MKPQNRKEVLLDAIANGKVPDITPETRKEAYLKKIAEKAAAGGNGGGGVLFIEEDYNESEDMSYPTVPYEEIVSAFNAGKMLYFNTGGSRPFIIPLAYVEDDTFEFQYITGYDLNLTVRKYRINENGVFLEEQRGQLKAQATES